MLTPPPPSTHNSVCIYVRTWIYALFCFFAISPKTLIFAEFYSTLLKAKYWECGKMGLNADNSLFEDYEIVCVFGLLIFLLNEVGCAVRTAFQLHVQMHNKATSYVIPVVLMHDLGEDS